MLSILDGEFSRLLQGYRDTPKPGCARAGPALHFHSKFDSEKFSILIVDKSKLQWKVARARKLVLNPKRERHNDWKPWDDYATTINANDYLLSIVLSAHFVTDDRRKDFGMCALVMRITFH